MTETNLGEVVLCCANEAFRLLAYLDHYPLATAIDDFSSGFNGIQKKVSDQIAP